MVLFNGNAEVMGNFRALNFYKAFDINIKEDIRLLVAGVGNLWKVSRTNQVYHFRLLIDGELVIVNDC